MFKGAKLSQDLCNKILFWVYLDSKCNVHRVLQPKEKAVSLMLIQFAFYSMDINVLPQMGGTHTFSGWCTVQRWTHPSLVNLEGQLHAQDRLEGGVNQF